MLVVIDKKSVIIKLSYIERVFAFSFSRRGEIRILREDIKSISWHESFSDWSLLMLRAPGTYMPYVLMAGSYWRGGAGWDFVYAKHPRGFFIPTVHNVAVIETKLNRYSRIIVQLNKEDAQSIQKWWMKK